MNTILKVIEQKEYDRFVFITYQNEEIVGLNFHQGTNEILYDFAEPCAALTEIFRRYSKNIVAHWSDRVNASIELYLDAFIFQKESTLIPESQRSIIKKALAFYLSQYKTFNQVPTDTEGFEMFDLAQLEALMNYDIKVELTAKEKEKFASKHGIDFPIYIY